MSQTLENHVSETYEKSGRWNQFSETKLIQLEQKILQILKRTYRGWFVNIGSAVGTDDKIWTIALNTESKKTPLVCVHGFGAAVGFWCLNLDALSEKRPVYAFDLLGFGRSSRPKFSQEALEAEKEMVDSIEAWRKMMDIEKFILMGHSFGAYLSASYSIAYPDRVKHLILADPWGFSEKPVNFNPPFHIKVLGFFLYPFTNFNPLATLRVAGPLGPWIVTKLRADISSKYVDALQDKELIANYIYQCNSQNPTGETAFHNMMKGFGWAKNPMLYRMNQLRGDIPITVLYGADTWMDISVGYKLIDERPHSYVKVEIIKDSGHHIHADQPELFNQAVVKACNQFDTKSEEQIPSQTSSTNGTGTGEEIPPVLEESKTKPEESIDLNPELDKKSQE